MSTTSMPESEKNDQCLISIRNAYATVLVSINSLTVLFDPIEINPDDYKNVDVVIVTHEHMDHFDKTLVKQIHDRTNSLVITSPFVANRLKGLKRVVRLSVGDSYSMKDINIFAEYCEHVSNNPLTFIMKTDHHSVYHSSDSSYFNEMQLIREKHRPKVLIYMRSSAEELLKISSAIGPDIVVCCQYPLLKEMEIPGIVVKTLKPGEWFVHPFGENPIKITKEILL